MKTTIINSRIVCKCGKDLGALENNKTYLCEDCEIVYFSVENALELYDKRDSIKRTALDWLK